MMVLNSDIQKNSAGVAIVPWAQHLQSSCLPTAMTHWHFNTLLRPPYWLSNFLPYCFILWFSAHFFQSHPTHLLLVRCPQLIWLWNFHLPYRISYYSFPTALPISLFFLPSSSPQNTLRVARISGCYLKLLFLQNTILSSQQAVIPGH